MWNTKGISPSGMFVFLWELHILEGLEFLSPELWWLCFLSVYATWIKEGWESPLHRVSVATWNSIHCNSLLKHVGNYCLCSRTKFTTSTGFEGNVNEVLLWSCHSPEDSSFQPRAGSTLPCLWVQVHKGFAFWIFFPAKVFLNFFFLKKTQLYKCDKIMSIPWTITHSHYVPFIYFCGKKACLYADNMPLKIQTIPSFMSQLKLCCHNNRPYLSTPIHIFCGTSFY